MPRVQVRYHRAILDSSGRVKHPSGAIIDSIDDVDPAQHDKLIVLEDAPRSFELDEVDPLRPEDEDNPE